MENSKSELGKGAEVIPFPAQFSLRQNAEHEEPLLHIESEKLYFDSHEYFESLYTSIDRARVSIFLEMYIWSDDEIGEMLFAHLKRAVARGVKVRVLVDGFGSFFWTLGSAENFKSAGIEVKIFRPFRWLRSPFALSPRRMAKYLSQMNHRNHKKLIVIDGDIAYTGSLNITRMSLEKRECGVRLSGSDHVSLLTDLFEDTWQNADSIGRKNFSLQKKLFRSKVVRSNQFYFLRRAHLSDLRRRISLARNRIWMMTPYFVPPLSLLSSLTRAARRGVDVRLILPYRSDVWFIRWITSKYYRFLLRTGVRVYEYVPQVLHAKETVIDGWATIGSSNLNRRSSFLDLELDIVLQEPDSVWELEKQFLRDFQECKEITSVRPLSIWKRIISRIIFYFRRWC